MILPVADDWVAIEKPITEQELQAVKSMGCAPRLGTWFAPDDAVAARADDATARFREAASGMRL